VTQSAVADRQLRSSGVKVSYRRINMTSSSSRNVARVGPYRRGVANLR
jgi:hypothetical protein